MSAIDRRQFGKLSAFAFLAGPLASLPGISLAANPTGRKLHGLSAFGDLKYAADYAHFDYVNVDAPKGGTFNFSVANWAFNQNPQTFDTLNTLVLKGNAPPRLEAIYDTLMTSASDEPSALYCALAESVELSEDRNSFTFMLRPEARWHDGTPVTAEDVAFTYATLKEKGHPSIAIALRELKEAVADDARTVRLVFSGDQSDRAILAAVGMPIISRAFYDTHDFTETTLTPPLGSGPYRVGKAKPGSFIEYERVEDYWARDMPFARGFYNFDVLRIEFYRDRQAAFEAFKKGVITYREEFTSKMWATEYDFPAVKEGKVKQQLFPSEKVPSFQGWAVNQRREKFQDPRTVRAIGLCFDFDWTNSNFFYDVYERSHSFFTDSEFEATGEPTPEELAFLEPLRGKIPDEAFGTAVMQPGSDGSGRDRRRLREALGLMKEAGWTRRGEQLVNASGEVFTIEFLIRAPTFERILGKFVENLKRIGVDASIRLVDPAQYQQRLDTFDFDITGIARRYGATPTQEGMEQVFASRYADTEGGANLAGIRNEGVDALVARIRDVTSREELVPLMRALDRVLRSLHAWIPNWHSANHRVAYWDMYGFPEEKPDYAFPVETTWWFEVDKARAIGKG